MRMSASKGLARTLVVSFVFVATSLSARTALAFTSAIAQNSHHALLRSNHESRPASSATTTTTTTTTRHRPLSAISSPNGKTTTTTSSSSSSSSTATSTNTNGTAASQKSSGSSLLDFENFDYENRWYPCIWEADLEENEPTRVTIFDVDYVVAKKPDGSVVAMKDYCTHKGAALSEGRVTDSGNFQCAYHGWSFDGSTGECVEIPQLFHTDTGKGSASASGGTIRSARIPARACGTAVPAQIHQEMVWLFPGGGLEKALSAPPPPSLPEYESEGGKRGLKMSTVVRDMPVDWPILVSNIFDPDHGLFAHQNKDFDFYAATLDCPFETFDVAETEGGGWSLSTRIDARQKIVAIGRSLREGSGTTTTKTKTKKKDDSTTPWATYHFDAPTTIRMKRIDKDTGDTKFVSFFHICPVGVGRSRFMAGGLSGANVPRWMSHLMFANFVDQDTYLLATQQQYVLSREAEELRGLLKEKGIDPSDKDDAERLKSLRMSTRRKHFCLASPSEKLGSTIEAFFDATLARCPNRVDKLLKLDGAGAFSRTPSREVVLDRKTQNLDVSRDSRDVVRNCRLFKTVAKVLSLVLSVAKIRSVVSLAAAAGGSPGPMRPFLKTSSLCASFLFLFATSFVANKWEKEYYFKYTDDMRRRDLKKIPSIWGDR